jgi:6-pyruvoyltetrahydropterin/6-carboxytetrahydropterin synthase
MIDLTRRYRFAASHRLNVDSFSPEKNVALFGKCNSPYGHGHDYILEVTACAPVDRETGLAFDQRTLDTLVESAVIKDLHMMYLNDQVPAFESVVPTTENLVVEIRRRLDRGWPTAFGTNAPELKRLRIIETRKNEFETE